MRDLILFVIFLIICNILVFSYDCSYSVVTPSGYYTMEGLCITVQFLVLVFDISIIIAFYLIIRGDLNE